MSSGIDDKQAGELPSPDKLKDFCSEHVEILEAVGVVNRSLFRHELGLDWYEILASTVFNVRPKEVTRKQRGDAKYRFFRAVNQALDDKGLL